MTAALGPFIQEEHAMVGPRHLTRHRHVVPADPPRIRDGMMRGTTRAGRDQRGEVAGEAGDAVDPRGLNRLGQVIAGRMVVSRRASIDVPGTLGPSMKNLELTPIFDFSRREQPWPYHCEIPTLAEQTSFYARLIARFP
jgi:hypothetical protein